MKSGFTLAWSFRNRKEILTESIQSADRTCPKHVDFCLIDAASDEDTIRHIREVCSNIKDRRIRICESSYRSSLAEAWNLGMMLTENRFVVFASSDVIFQKEGWLDMIVGGLSTHQYVLMENHAVFCLDKKAIPKMGWFDENFKSGPHFDPDLMIRASENGVEHINVWNEGFYIHGDEGDEKVAKERTQGEVADRLPMHDFHNEDYFKRKWSSQWSGWRDAIARGEANLPHPPTHISQVSRLSTEEDPHPIYTRKYK